MTQPVKTVTAAEPTAATQDAAAIRAAALAEDGQRRADIKAKFSKFADRDGVQALQTVCESDVNISAQTAADKLLAHLGSQASPIAGGVVIVQDEADKRIEAMTQSIMARAGVSDAKGRVIASSANPYRGAKLLDLARASLQSCGIKSDLGDQRALVAAAFTQSTSDFPILLENVMHKTLQAAYALQADTWTRFCARGSVGDFRAHPRYRVGSLGNLNSKNELGEFRNKSIPDGEKASITAATKGNVINISRETIINDDLGALTGLSAMLGRAAKRTIEADVYATLALNSGMGPTLTDGVTLFHADHANVSTGAPTVTSFEAARLVMAAQKDVSGNDYLDLKPAIWLGNSAQVGAAKVVLNSTYDPDTANKLQRANIAAGMVQDIVDSARPAATVWYFFANPNEAPVLEVAFLNGNNTPYLEMENGFTVDGSRWKVRMDYGIAGVDYRGAVRSTGA